MPTHRVNSAVRDCMAQCALSQTPVAVAAAYIQKLEFDPDWTPDEIRDVRLGVGQLLLRLVTGVTDGD